MLSGEAGSARWFIIRCSGASTVRLAAALQAAGIAAWTPVERIARRVPRVKTKERLTVAMTPTYVFVRDADLIELKILAQAEFTNLPRFSIFRYYHATVFIRHAALHALRAREQASYVASLPSTGTYYEKPRGNPLSTGDKVNFLAGPFAGLPCTVQSSDGRTTTLSLTLFGRESGIKVETCELRDDGVATVASAA